MGWDALTHILPVKREHPNMTTGQPQVVDYPQATALSAPRGSPSEFPYTSGARNDLSGLRMFVQKRLQLAVLVVVEVAIKALVKTASR